LSVQGGECYVDENGDFVDFWDWEDIAMVGFLAEEIADEEREKILIEKDMEDNDAEGNC